MYGTQESIPYRAQIDRNNWQIPIPPCFTEVDM